MEFQYTKQYLKGYERVLQRFLEIVPGCLSWLILLSATALSILNPTLAAIFIIAFYLYWLLRLLYMTLFLALSYYRLKVEEETDWMARVEGIDHFAHYLPSLYQKTKKLTFRQGLSHDIHKKELLVLQSSNSFPPPSNNIYHVVIYPVVKESKDIIEPGLKSLSEQKFPAERMLVVFALEDRAPEEIKETIFSLEKKYKQAFFDILTILHPSDLKGESRVKGANITWAARHTAQFLKEKNIPYENVIVSCFDADTIVGAHYFSCLTYYFMISPRRLQSSFQPIPVYHNNIWEVPAFARVMECGSSFFQLVEATNPEKLVTFSSHSMSFKALVGVDYWPVDMISDDSAIYWKSFIHFDGQYDVVPMYVTLSMDIAGSKNFWETAKSIYHQKRRWAWGVENFPIVLRAFLKSKKISLYNKLRHGFKLLEGHISWATWGFLLSFIGWLPALFTHLEYPGSVIYYNTPRVTATIFRLATISLITSIIISTGLLPKGKKKERLLLTEKITHALEWLTLPFVLVFFSALPALDAQTRLMLGRPLQFRVTEKKRKNNLGTKL